MNNIANQRDEWLTDPAIPPCPVCQSKDPVMLYGRQTYPVVDHEVPSLIFRCRACDFNFRRFGRPLAEALSHFQVAPYSSDEIERQWLKRRVGFYDYLLDLLTDPAEGKSLLDVGCAFGHFLDRAVLRGYRPFGTEVSEDMAHLLRRRRDYPISSRPLNDLRLPETQFDVITFVDSFYYFEDPLDTLLQCHRLLKPRGHLLMRVTNRNPMARLHRMVLAMQYKSTTAPEMPFWTTDDAISCHSQKSLRTLMNRAGYRIMKISCLERGKRIESMGLWGFYIFTSLLAMLTFQGVSWTPGLICLARRD